MEIVLWILLSFLLGTFARTWGRSFFWFTFFSLVLSPLLGLVALLFHGKDGAVLTERLVKSGKCKQCPQCLKAVPTAAQKCSYCGSSVAAVQAMVA